MKKILLCVGIICLVAGGKVLANVDFSETDGVGSGAATGHTEEDAAKSNASDLRQVPPDTSGVEKNGREKTSVVAQNRAEVSVDRRIEQARRLSERIDQIKGLTDEKKAALKGRLETHVQALLENQKNSRPQDDLQTNNANGDFVVPQGFMIGAIDRINTIADILQRIAGKLENQLNQLELPDNESEAIRLKIDELKGFIKKAKDAGSAASAIIGSTEQNNEEKAGESVRAKIDEARGYISEATRSLKSARETAVSAMRQIKEMQSKDSRK